MGSGVGRLAIDACWVGDGGEWGFGEISFRDVDGFCLSVLSGVLFRSFLRGGESSAHHGERLGG